MTARRFLPRGRGGGARMASSASVPRSVSLRLRTRSGQALAASAFVVSVAAGWVASLVTGRQGWALVTGIAALLLIVGLGAVLAWLLEGQQEGRAGPGTGPDTAASRPGLGSVAPPWGLRPARVRGRDELIAELGGLMAVPDGHVHVLSGLGGSGSGKTTIALAVAELARPAGRAWWISARDRSSVDSGLIDLAGALEVTGKELEQARTGRRSVLDLVWERLDAATGPWVLVVDNADTPELLAADGGRVRDGNGVARASGRGLTIVTSRNGDRLVWGDGAVIHAIGPLRPGDSADMLLDLSGPTAGTREDAAALAQRLGCLPLAMRAAGRYLSSTVATLDGVRTFDAYRADLDARFSILQGSVLPESDPRDIVMTTWEASLDLLAERGHPDARPFMRIIGQFAPAPIPVEILDPARLAASGLLSRSGRRAGWLRMSRSRPHFGKHELHLVIMALAALGLLDTMDYQPAPQTGIRTPCPPAIPCRVVHPLVVEVNAEALRQEQAMQQAAVTTIVTMVSAAAGKADPRSPVDAATWPLLAPHIELLAASVPQLPADDMVRFASAADRTAAGLRHGGDFPAALHLLIRAREAVGRLAPEHPAVLALRHNYAYVIDDLGRFADAEAEYRSILAARVRSLGADDPLTLSTRNHLAFALSRQRKFAEAEEEYRTVLQGRKELLGDEHQDTLTTRNNLADVLYGQRRYDEAARHYQEVLQAQLRLLGPEHPRTLTTRNNLARNQTGQGRPAEAEGELRAILTLRRDSRGAEHPSTLATWHDLAAALASQGHLAKARQEFAGVLAARRRVLGENHPDTIAAAEALENDHIATIT